MDRTISPQRLFNKVKRLEEELRTIREEVRGLQRQAKEPEIQPPSAEFPFSRIDQAALRRWGMELLRLLGIEKEPVDIRELQRLSGSADLEPDEISRALIQAREE